MDHVTRVRAWLKEQGYDGVILSRRDNFTWISGGAKNAVCTNTEAGIGYYVISAGEVKLLADSSDAPRMGAEQNPLGGEVVLVPWYESMDAFIREMADGKTYVSDTGIGGTKNVQSQLVDLRLRLDPEEVERYREIGQACAQIVEGVCRDAKPGQTEEEVAADLKCRCIRQGISPDCVLVGSDERILNYRHPVPTDKKIEKSLMVVLGGEKYGLNISMTRMVYFEPVPEEIRERYEKTAYIFACMQLHDERRTVLPGIFQKSTGTLPGGRMGRPVAETPPGRTHRLRLPGIHSRPGYGKARCFAGKPSHGIPQ